MKNSITIKWNELQQQIDLRNFYMGESAKRKDIDATMRISWNGKEFFLTGEPVDWKTARGGITLLAKEVT